MIKRLKIRMWKVDKEEMGKMVEGQVGTLGMAGQDLHYCWTRMEYRYI